MDDRQLTFYGHQVSIVLLQKWMSWSLIRALEIPNLENIVDLIKSITTLEL
jgi:hypothetical protein